MVEKTVGVTVRVDRHSSSKVGDRLRQRLRLEAISKSRFHLGSLELTFETTTANEVHRVKLDRETGAFTTASWRSVEHRILREFDRWLKKWERAA